MAKPSHSSQGLLVFDEGGQDELGFAQPGFALFNGIGPFQLVSIRLARGDTAEGLP